MTAFFDRQGTLVLLLVILLGLCYFVAYAFNHQPSTTPAEVVTTYLTALKNGDIKAAYALLSEEDKKYFDVDRFRIFLYRQPQLQLLYGGGELNRAQLLRTYMSFVQVQTKDQATQQDNEVIMKVTLPDISKILGSELLQYYLFGEEHQFLTVEQNLALSKRLEARLRTLRNAPTQSGYHKFTLVKHNRNWQLSAPEWRVEAMLYEAKQNLVKQETKEAARLLDEASSFVLQVDQLTRKTVVSEAIAGNQMLRYLPNVEIAEFRLEKQTSACRYPVKLELSNEGERGIRSVDIAVQFMNDKNKDVVDDQVIELNKTSLERRVASQTLFLPVQETVAALACLRPPRNWSGLAKTHVVWLKFAEAAQ